MKSDKSLLVRTRQMWKVRVSVIGPLIAVPIAVWAVWLQLNSNTSGRVIAGIGLLGACIALIGILTPYTIRCPRCRARWYALATSRLRKGWYRALMSQPICQVCGYTGTEPASAIKGQNRKSELGGV
jgi:hypothetical protein